MLTTLFESAVRSIAIAIVLGVALRLMRIRNPQTLSTVWTAVLFSAMAMPLLMPVVKVVVASVPPETVAWMPNASLSPFFLRPPTSGTVPTAMPLVERAATALAIVYAIVAGVALLRIGAGILRGHRLRRAAIQLNEAWASGWE